MRGPPVHERRGAARRRRRDHPLLRAGAADRGVGRALAEELRARAHARRGRATADRRRRGRSRSRRRCPAAQLPCAGVTVVGVLPTHRRRGILRSMMRVQLDDAHERGEPIATLFASEETIYGRYGYGLASLNAFDVAKSIEAFRPGVEAVGRVRLVDPDEAAKLLPPVYDAVRRSRPGCSSAARPGGRSAARRPRVPGRRRAEALRRARGRRRAAGLRDLPPARRVGRLRAGVGRAGERGDGRDARGDRLALAVPARHRLDEDGHDLAPAGRPPALPPPRPPEPRAADASATASGCGSSTSAQRCRRGRTRARARSSSTSATSSARGTRAAGGSRAARRAGPRTRTSRSTSPTSARSTSAASPSASSARRPGRGAVRRSDRPRGRDLPHGRRALVPRDLLRSLDDPDRERLPDVVRRGRVDPQVGRQRLERRAVAADRVVAVDPPVRPVAEQAALAARPADGAGAGAAAWAPLPRCSANTSTSETAAIPIPATIATRIRRICPRFPC